MAGVLQKKTFLSFYGIVKIEDLQNHIDLNSSLPLFFLSLSFVFLFIYSIDYQMPSHVPKTNVFYLSRSFMLPWTKSTMGNILYKSQPQKF